MADSGGPRFGLDFAVALGVYGVLLALARLENTPVAAPGLALSLGFDAVRYQLAPGLGGGGRAIAFFGYVIGLAAGAGWIAGRLRRRFDATGRFRYGLAGAVLAVVGYAVVVAGALVVAALPPGWSPVAISILVSIAGLWVGRRLASRRATASSES